MITKVIKVLESDDFYGISENVEIAKGKYKIVRTLPQFWRQLKRAWKWQRK
jgi:hypothetical protein